MVRNMEHFDAIRGRKPTKTELILKYMVDRPKEVLTPKEIADGLNFNLQTTVTVLNRLALEGAIGKKGRGQFYYERKEKGELGTDAEEAKAIKVSSKTKPLDIDKKTAAEIYKTIYILAGESTGTDLLSTVTGLGLGDFDKKAPFYSIQDLVRALTDLLGKEMAGDIVSIALEKELTEKKAMELKNRLFD